MTGRTAAASLGTHTTLATQASMHGSSFPLPRPISRFGAALPLLVVKAEAAKLNDPPEKKDVVVEPKPNLGTPETKKAERRRTKSGEREQERAGESRREQEREQERAGETGTERQRHRECVHVCVRVFSTPTAPLCSQNKKQRHRHNNSLSPPSNANTCTHQDGEDENGRDPAQPAGG